LGFTVSCLWSLFFESEFEQTILEDLELLDIKGDSVSHTSDYFDKLYELAVKMIKTGKAYADDTEQAQVVPYFLPRQTYELIKPQMREERGQGIASRRRGATVEENLSRFEEMTKGTEEGLRWCLRAKLSVDNPNKAMRDPVIYRCNLLPHHRTGYVIFFSVTDVSCNSAFPQVKMEGLSYL